MTASPWDGRSRRALRVGLSVVFAFDACLLAIRVMTTRPGPSSLAGPGLAILLALGGHPLRVAPLVVVALAALAMFAGARRPLLAGAVALLSISALSTTLTALQGQASRNFYTAGATLLGWWCGELAARGLSGNRAVARRDALAESGAAGAFAATYFAAGTSKLLVGGVSWADASSLQSLVLSQHSISDPTWRGSYALAIAHSPWLAISFAIATLIMELGAFVFVAGARARMLWGAIFIAFHVNVFLLTDIPYVENVALALLLAFPWPLVSRRRVPRVEEPPLPWRSLAEPAGVLLALAVAMSFVPARLRPVGDAFAQALPAAPPPLPGSPVLGPLRTGQALTGGWSIDRIVRRPREARIRLARGSDRVELVLSLDTPPHGSGPFSRGGVDVSYRSTALAFDAFAPAARVLVSRLDAAAGAGGVRAALERWLVAP